MPTHRRMMAAMGSAAGLAAMAILAPASSPSAAQAADPPARRDAVSAAPAGPGHGKAGAAVPAAGGSPQGVLRLVVRTRSGAPLAPERLDALDLPADVRAGLGRSIGMGMSVITLSGPIDPADAAALAGDLAAAPDVLWAESDGWSNIQDAPPITPNDPRFPEQWDLWDSSSDDRAGGWGARVPRAWDISAGSSSVTVAVIDTGITVHPDLAASIVSGYDFVGTTKVANDGDGWDPDPSDPGDWISSSDLTDPFFDGCRQENSSWHGTHVAGTIAAVRDNLVGISGIAPGVRVQPVRVLGKCGGYNSDIATGITWASGGSIPGVAVNPTPAKVINLSLGGSGTCSATYQTAINGARARGTTVVVAAGNSASNLASFQPASCAGVLAITATDIYGQRAAYSNVGTVPGAAALAAPGGDSYYGTSTTILSTLNSGTTVPGSPTYAFYQGTSMATPHVVAAAALIDSVTPGLTPDQVADALKSATTDFPVYGDSYDCTTITCGTGLLDFTRLLPASPEVRTVVPERLLDTRSGSQVGYAGAKPTAGQTVELQVADAGATRVPGSARAVVLNVTGTQAAANGFVTVWPCGGTRPQSSTLNLTPDGSRANLVITGLGTGGSVCLYTSVSAHLLADISAYLPSTATVVSGSPERLLDTRPATRVGYVGDKPVAGQTVELQVAGAGLTSVPGSARAVVLNVTGTQPTAAGFVTVWPCGTTRPTASTLNLTTGSVANLVVTALGTDGTVCLYTHAGAHLIADVSGYFPSTAPVVPVQPERLLDTRPTSLVGYTGAKPVAGQTVPVQVLVTGATQAPESTQAVLLNVTGVQGTAAGYVTVWPCGATRPVASTLNLLAGATVPNLVLVRPGTNGRVCLYTHAGAHLLADIVGYMPASA